jgi:hypothetical protein
MKVERDPQKIEIEQSKNENAIVALKIKEINGKQYLVHEVGIYDSIQKLSLKYNVSIQLLRQTNNLMSDEIF